MLGGYLLGTNSQNVSSGTDIITLLPGCYKTASKDINDSLVNIPSTADTQYSFRLFVMSLYGSANYKNIILIAGSDIFICYVYYQNGEFRHNGWKKFTNTDVI